MRSSSTVAAALLLALLVPACTACRCFPPTLCQTYDNPYTLSYVRAKVLKVKMPTSQFGDIKYRMKLLQNYKGCPPSKKFSVFSSPSSAACRILLRKKAVYVLPVRSGRRPRIGSCDFIRLFSVLTNPDLTFLNTRNVCCKDSCACSSGDQPVNCLQQPCSPPETAPPACVMAKCVDNYCGGCFAEWFEKNGKRCKRPMIGTIHPPVVVTE